MSKDRKFFGILVLIGMLVTGSLVSGCKKENESKKTETKKPKAEGIRQTIPKRKTGKSFLIQVQESNDWRKEADKYFPIKTGNEWKYKIVVPEGVTIVREYRKFQFPKAKKALSQFGPVLFKSGEYILHLKVGKKVSQQGALHKYKEGWEVAVLQDDGKLYEGVEKIFWIRSPSRDRWVEEIRVYGLEYTMKEFDATFALLMNSWIHEPAEAWKILYYYQPEWADTDRMVIINRINFYKYLRRNQSVTVPAGSFNGVTVIEEETKGEEDQDKWKTLLFYAPNVGLVKAERKDLQGNILTTMELIDYKVK